MADLYLPLLDDAVIATAEALRLFEREIRRVPKKRDPWHIAQAVRLSHLAIEKLLKHVLASVDPYLLLSKPDPRFLRELHKERQSLATPSILASRQRLNTFGAEDVWDHINELLDPDLDEAVLSRFAAALGRLTSKRNQCQHGELFGDSDGVLGIVEESFAQLPVIAAVLCPSYLEMLEQRTTNGIARLRALAARVDAGWLMLVEYLDTAGHLEFIGRFTVSRSPHSASVQLLLSGDESTSDALANSLLGKEELSGIIDLPLDQTNGLFSRLITVEEERSRQEARVRSSRRIPSPPGLGRTLQLVTQADFHESLHEAFAEAYRLEREAAEKYGLTPLESGRLHVESAPAWLRARVGSGEGGRISTWITLSELWVVFRKKTIRGRVRGTLRPDKRAAGAFSQPLAITGTAWLTNELVVSEADASESYPTGTVIRYFRARFRIRKQVSEEKTPDVDLLNSQSREPAG